MDTKYKGAYDDRTLQEKSQDYKWDELNVLGAVVLEERMPVAYTPRNQDGSGSCVAQTTAKMLEIWDYKHDKEATVYSAAPIYQNRSNRPATGMVGVEALSLAVKGNVYLESDVPSQNINDPDIDKSPIDVLKRRVEHPNGYVVLPILPIRFDAVVQEVLTSGAVMVWFKSDYQEWCKNVPMQINDNEGVRHSVCAVDAVSFKGNDYIIIEDSWGTWENNSDIPLHPRQRAISREFLKIHCYFAAAFTSFEFEGGAAPKYTWKLPMKYGQTSDDIKAWQEMLKYEKFFPSNQDVTGYFGGITAKATQAWQIAHKLYDFQNETDMRRIVAGPKSIAEANRIYSSKK